VKKLLLIVLTALSVMGLASCTNDADVVSDNISKEADNFGILRKVVAINTFTDKYLLDIEGWCNIVFEASEKQLEVTCKRRDGYTKDFVGMGDNVAYTVLQLESANVSKDHYKVTFKPSTVIPDIEVR
jgi:hypothetical protein